MPFSRNVFVNCPFDDDYKALFKSLLFTILYLGFEPRISQTKSSSTIRINQIMTHIRESMYGVHDLSRSRPLRRDDLPRFNMPYELGLDVGCSVYGGARLKRKKLLILEKEKYHYQRILSDISGQDIEHHEDDPKNLIRKVRNWFSINDGKRFFAPPAEIWNAYNQFRSDLVKNLRKDGHSQKDINEMPMGDFIKFAKNWITTFKSGHGTKTNR